VETTGRSNDQPCAQLHRASLSVFPVLCDLGEP
jgi:hypothetical protein